MSNDPPTGHLYGHVYIPKGDPTDITPRLRKRIYGYFQQVVDNDMEYHMADLFHRELGEEVPNIGGYGGYKGRFDKFFDKTAVVTLFHAITLVWRHLMAAGGHQGEARQWLANIKRAFAEENVRYRIDAEAGVHPLVDAVFEDQRVGTIATLTGVRYSATLELYEKAQEALTEQPAETREAIRYTFDALENLFKLMFPTAPRLSTQFVNQQLAPAVSRHYNDKTANSAADKMVKSFCDWIDGAHFYRHNPGTPAPAPPPLDFTIVAMSTGAGFLRWLAEIDRAGIGAAPA